jgi:hypothetical protein
VPSNTAISRAMRGWSSGSNSLTHQTVPRLRSDDLASQPELAVCDRILLPLNFIFTRPKLVWAA